MMQAASAELPVVEPVSWGIVEVAVAAARAWTPVQRWCRHAAAAQGDKMAR
jgi:hypothetical protein